MLSDGVLRAPDFDSSPRPSGLWAQPTVVLFFLVVGLGVHSIGVQPDIVIDPKVIQVAKNDPAEGKEAGKGSTTTSANTPETETKEASDPNAPQPVPAGDVQLLKAVEMLKSWKVFKQILPAA